MTSILFFVKVHMAGLMSLAAAPLFTFLILREVIHHRSIDNPGTGHLPPYRHSAVSLPAAPSREETGHDEALIIPDSPQQRSFLYDGPAFYDEGYELDEDSGDRDDELELGTEHLFPFKKPGHN
jgi:hypothetical protein